MNFRTLVIHAGLIDCYLGAALFSTSPINDKLCYMSEHLVEKCKICHYDKAYQSHCDHLANIPYVY